MTNDATLKINLEFDDGEIEIVAHGTTLNMQRLEARLKRGLAADKELAAIRTAKHCATLHDDGRWTWNRTLPYESSFAGWRLNVYLAAGAQPAPIKKPHYILSTCPECRGRGVSRAYGYDDYSDGFCQDCNGTGKAPVLSKRASHE